MPRIIKSKVAAILLLLALGLGLFTWKLGEAPLSGTEGHRAITAHQILEHDNWLLPSLYGELYLRKPPLHYWLLAGAEKLTVAAPSSVAGVVDPGSNKASPRFEAIWRLPSALSAALTAVLMALFARRWFGPAAFWPAGLFCLGLIPLWSQSRSADIDAVNTLLTMAASLGLLEIKYGSSTRKTGWIFFTGIAFGLALLQKGPACLPAVLGAWIGSSIALRDNRWRCAPALWKSLSLGLALFGTWLFAAWRALAGTQANADTSGLEETLMRLSLKSLLNLGQALILPVELVLFALPASLALIWLIRQKADSTPLQKALAGTLLFAFVVGLLTGMTNMRYGYVLLPLLAFAPGILAARQNSNDWNLFTKLSALVFAGTAIAFSIISNDWKTGAVLFPIIGTFAAIAAFRFPTIGKSNVILALLIVCAGLSFAGFKNAERTKRSGYAAAQVVRQTLQNSTNRVYASVMVMTHPEVFYYAGLNATWDRNRHFIDTEIPPGAWAIFMKDEWDVWNEKLPGEWEQATPLPTHVPGAMLARRQTIP